MCVVSNCLTFDLRPDFALITYSHDFSDYNEAITRGRQLFHIRDAQNTCSIEAV
jgi:hypothetical protein